MIDRNSAERIVLRQVLMPWGIYMHYFTPLHTHNLKSEPTVLHYNSIICIGITFVNIEVIYTLQNQLKCVTLQHNYSQTSSLIDIKL